MRELFRAQDLDLYVTLLTIVISVSLFNCMLYRDVRRDWFLSPLLYIIYDEAVMTEAQN